VTYTPISADRILNRTFTYFFIPLLALLPPTHAQGENSGGSTLETLGEHGPEDLLLQIIIICLIV